LTKESVLKEIYKNTNSIKEKAFQTILKNRTYHGGILANGSGLLKYGENGKGIHSRWYPETLAKRFLNLNFVIKKIEFQLANGLDVMQKYLKDQNAIFFIDPPYTAGEKKAGKRLYKYYETDHERLFELCESLKGHFLMTYDNAEEVIKMAKDHGFQTRLIPMNNTHHATMEELVISRDLSWMDDLKGVREPSMKYSIKKKHSVKNGKK
jgi:DNA adenine methylase